MRLNNFSFCAFVLVFVCAIHVGESLKCYSCNVTTPFGSKGDACRGHETLQQCQNSAVCLAATYSYEDSSMMSAKIIIKSCYMSMGGNECEIFLKNIKNLHPPTTKISFSESCATCSDDECNRATDSGSSSKPTFKSAASAVSSLLLLSFISFAATKLL